MSQNVIWCGEHLGTRFCLAEKNRSYEISLYRTFWSAAGSGVTVFARFSESTGLEALTGIYTNNKELTEHLQASVLRAGKPETNIANTLGGPVVNAKFDQVDNIPASRSESFLFDQQKVEVKWNLADQAHMQKDTAPENEDVMYNYATIKPTGFEIKLEGVIQKKISTVELYPLNEYDCFFAICEVWSEDNS